MDVTRRLLEIVDAALEGRRAGAADMTPHAQISWVENCLPPDLPDELDPEHDEAEQQEADRA